MAREPWHRFALKAVLLLALLYAGGSYLGDRFIIGIDPQISRCLPDTHVVLIDRYDREPERGSLVAFRAHGLQPWFSDGTLMVKVVDGLPGDQVEVSAAGVIVNGDPVGEGLDLAATLERPVAEFERDLVVPEGGVWVMGRTRDSFDSRYYGVADERQIVGRAYRIF